MGGLLVSLALSGLGREAVRLALGLAVAIVLAAAFATSALAALVTGALNPGALATTRALPGVGAGPGPGPWPALRAAAPLRAAATGADAVPAGTAEQAMRAASTAIGTPYLWGGADPRTGMDCSGLVQWAYRQAGIALPRTAQQQFDATLPVRPDQLRPGDLTFFVDTYKQDPAEPITHVGIYLGNGRMLNAPREGERVQELPVFAGYWGAHFAGGGRVIAPPTTGAGARR